MAARLTKESRCCGSPAFIVGTLMTVAAVMFASAGYAGDTLTFSAAHERVLQVSDQLAASDAAVRNQQRQAQSLSWLGGPQIDFEVKEIELQKTVDLPLGDLNAFLSQLPDAPTEPLPDEISLRDRGDHFRPQLSATLPLYTGGKIAATQDVAAAGVKQAEAEVRQQQETLSVTVVKAYFGCALAERVLSIRTDVLAGLEAHLANAVAMQQQGMASQTQRLQAQVARDEAARALLHAEDDLRNARVVLTSLLRDPSAVALGTPLFVITRPLTDWMPERDGWSAHPALQKLAAQLEQSEGGVRIEQSKLRPQVFAFGQYDLYRHDALLTEPDWVYGIGLKFPLLSNVDRRDSIAAAQERSAQIGAGTREAVTQLQTQFTVARNRLETAQRQFVLLASSTSLAEENLRLQDIAFREGQATSVDVIDARLSLGRARVERAQAAYQFEEALAQVLAASGRAGQFTDYIALADEVIP
jgi:outer membrane protein TolC